MKKQIGISVVVSNKEEFDHVKRFLTPEVLYLDWHDNMKIMETSIVLKANKNSDFSSGGVGSSEYQKKCGIKIFPFSENLTQYLIN